MMNPPSHPLHGSGQAPVGIPGEQRQSAAVAQILARQSEGDMALSVPSARFNQLLPPVEQQLPLLHFPTNPLAASRMVPPPHAQYPPLRRPQPPLRMTDAQAAFHQNRLLQARSLLLQQQQQQQQQHALQLEANENARILAEAQRLSNLKNNLDPPFGLGLQPQPFQDGNSVLLRALAATGGNPDPLVPGPDLVPYLSRADADKANKLKAKNEEEQVITFLGSTTRATKNGMYFDASILSDVEPTPASRRTRGGVTEPFPEKVHRMLTDCEANDNQDIVSFLPHGRAFGIHKPNRFVKEILPNYFRQSQLSSFQRQLNLYGFTRISSGPDEGGYFHELFLRGRPSLCAHMRRVGVPTIFPNGEVVSRRDRRNMNAKRKGTTLEPDFYSMKPITIKTAEASKDGEATSTKEEEGYGSTEAEKDKSPVLAGKNSDSSTPIAE